MQSGKSLLYSVDTSVSLYHTALSYITDDRLLHCHRHENLRSPMLIYSSLI
jgi:hypothetical protein